MANYVSVAVRVEASNEAVLGIKKALTGFISLKAAMEASPHKVEDADGKFLDYRSTFDTLCYGDGVVGFALEQPWNVNLVMFEEWVKKYDENAKVFFAAHYWEDNEFTTNDPDLFARKKRSSHWYWEDIDE